MLPLSVKLVSPLDFEMVGTLPSFYPDAKEFFLSFSKYLHDLSLYDNVPRPTDLNQTGFTRDEERLMEGHKFVRFEGEPRGATYGFKVAQFFKKCSRPVWNCLIKEYFKGSLPHYHLQNAKRIASRLSAIAGPDTVFIQFDFSAYYDQFALLNGIPAMFCFRDRFKNICSLTRLPMGFTLACAIAQGTTWQLLNFEHKSAVFTCIDNVAFAGTPDQVLHDVALFLERCASVSATLNEISAEQISAFLALSADAKITTLRSWHKDEFTFLGVEYSWSSRKRCMAEKSVDKLTAAKTCVEALSDTILPKQLATVIGLLRYADSVLYRPAYEFYNLLRWTRGVASHMQSDPSRWDSVSLKLPPQCRADLLDWFEAVLPNTPVAMWRPLPTSAPNLTLITDASAQGWGAVVLRDSVVTPLAGRWLSPIKHSVHAEPAAVYEAVVRSMSATSEDIVLILSDHLPLTLAAKSAAPRAFSYNNLLLRLSRDFPKATFLFDFLPGSLNLADALSRGETSVPKEVQELASQYAGTGWANAFCSYTFGRKCTQCEASVPWQC